MPMGSIIVHYSGGKNMIPSILIFGEQKDFCVPATLAPSKCIFIVASNAINKKRAHLTPNNSALLMFLSGNKDAVSWG
jgi:hypothetical protein